MVLPNYLKRRLRDKVVVVDRDLNWGDVPTKCSYSAKEWLYSMIEISIFIQVAICVKGLRANIKCFRYFGRGRVKSGYQWPPRRLY